MRPQQRPVVTVATERQTPWRSFSLLALLLLLLLGALLVWKQAAPRLLDAPDLSGLSLAPRVELDLAGYLERFERPPLGFSEPTGRPLAGQVRAFYQRRHLAPAWFVEGRLRPEARELVGLLGELGDSGLDPAVYRPALLNAEMAQLGGGEAAFAAEQLEVGLTWAALLAATHLRHGRVEPAAVGSLWKVEREAIDLPAVLEEALASGRLAETLRRLDPDHPQFVALRQALRRYRQIAAAGGWPEVPRGPVLVEGEEGDAGRLRALAARLHAEGFLPVVPPELAAAPAPGGAGSRLVYGRELAEAVRRFQATRTLHVDGSLGPQTQEELLVPIGARLRQIELNLERWRWVPDDFGRAAVVVNIPGYTLDLEEDRRIVGSMAVVVGEEGWETPVFADRIEYVVLNPYWNVPSSILEEEILPQVSADPSYLAAHDMEVVRGETDDAPRVSDALVFQAAEDAALRVRQRPGPRNPLGQLKIMFPNPHNIYLHDTPATHLFREPDRSASHGCIRVERPIDLAAYLLRETGWTAERLQTAIARRQTEEVALPRPHPVFLLYFTAVGRPGGALELYEDIYGVDQAHARALGHGLGSGPRVAARAAS